MLRFADFAETGSWPVAGGVLDQAKPFLDACQLVAALRSRWRNDVEMLSDGKR